MNIITLRNNTLIRSLKPLSLIMASVLLRFIVVNRISQECLDGICSVWARIDLNFHIINVRRHKALT